MFRTPPTRILLCDYEVHQTIQSIWTHRLMTLNLAYCPPVEEEGEKDDDGDEYLYDSFVTSYTSASSEGQLVSEHERYVCNLLRRYRDTKIYLDSSTLELDDLPPYSVTPQAPSDTHLIDHREGYQPEGVYQPPIEIPDSQTSSPPQESSTASLPSATIILCPRSPVPPPQVLGGRSRMHRSGEHASFPVLQVQVPDIYSLLTLAMTSTPPLRDTYSRLPPRPVQQRDWTRYLLAQPLQKKSTALEKVHSAGSPTENVQPKTTHGRRIKESLVLEVIGQDAEESGDNEERSGRE